MLYTVTDLKTKPNSRRAAAGWHRQLEGPVSRESAPLRIPLCPRVQVLKFIVTPLPQLLPRPPPLSSILWAMVSPPVVRRRGRGFLHIGGEAWKLPSLRSQSAPPPVPSRALATGLNSQAKSFLGLRFCSLCDWLPLIIALPRGLTGQR